MKNETAFSKFLQKLAQDCGFIDFNVHGHARQRSGWPDLEIYMFLSRSILLELKFNKGKLSALQKITIEDLRARGHICGVLRYISDEEMIVLENTVGRQVQCWDVSTAKTKPCVFFENLYYSIEGNLFEENPFQ